MTPRTTLLDGVHATHAGATAECAARGLRLCSRAELQQCCKMGCGLDKHPTYVETKAARPSASWLSPEAPVSARPYRVRASLGRSAA